MSQRALLCERRERKRRVHNAPLAEVLDTLGGEDVVVPLPGELSLHETLGRKALHGLDDLEVGNIEFFVLRRVVVLLGYQNTLCADTPQ